MQITLSDLKADAKKYVTMVDTTDIVITCNGNPLAKLVAVKQDKEASLKTLLGAIPSEIDYDKLREERFHG